MPNTRLNPNFEARTKINSLWEQVFLPSTTERPPFLDEVPDRALRKYGISRIPFGFEIKDPRSNDTGHPPILFCPLPESTLHRYPADSSKLVPPMVEFRDYNPPADSEANERHYWGPWHCAQVIHYHLDAWAGGGFPRTGIPEPFFRLREYRNLSPIRLPNVFILDGSLEQMRLPFYGSWASQTILEYRENDKLHHPHVVLITLQSCNGREDSMLMGELAPIIEAMKHRADQPKVMEGEDEEKLFEKLENNPAEQREQAFPEEKRFPILMVSLLGPQHARLFYACIDNDELVIRQSKLFSFEKGATAPWDFFACWLLSSPLTEPASK